MPCGDLEIKYYVCRLEIECGTLGGALLWNDRELSAQAVHLVRLTFVTVCQALM